MDSFRFTEVPGSRVVDAYCALAEQASAASTHHATQTIEAQMRGFRQAVEIYCPDTPGYSCTSGHLIMAADRHIEEIEQSAPDCVPMEASND